MIKVAQLMHSYLVQTQTFIWQYISQFKNISPVIIADIFENLNQFPITQGKLYQVNGTPFSRSWLVNLWYEKILKHPVGYAEHIINKEQIQLMHAHFGTTACRYLPVSLSSNIPLITTFYGFDLSQKETIGVFKQEYINLFRNGALFLVEGPYMLQKLVSLGCPKEKITIQRIAIDLDNYSYKKKECDGLRPARLLFVGRFVEKKGLEYAITALSLLKEKHHFEFRIIGDGELKNHLLSLASSLGFTDEIIWLGIQPYKKMIKELELCDILIQPSVTATDGDSEGGAPTIILEAQAMGIPVISSFHADIPYITVPNKSALLSPERDIEALAENINYLLEHPEIWAEIGKKGRNHIETHHDIKKEVIALESLYNEILKR